MQIYVRLTRVKAGLVIRPSPRSMCWILFNPYWFISEIKARSVRVIRVRWTRGLISGSPGVQLWRICRRDSPVGSSRYHARIVQPGSKFFFLRSSRRGRFKNRESDRKITDRTKSKRRRRERKRIGQYEEKCNVVSGDVKYIVKYKVGVERKREREK